MSDNDLYIDVKAYGGAHIPDVIVQMVELAGRLQIDIWVELNGVRTLARQNDAPALIEVAWRDALDKKRSHASAS